MIIGKLFEKKAEAGNRLQKAYRGSLAEERKQKKLQKEKKKKLIEERGVAPKITIKLFDSIKISCQPKKKKKKKKK